MVPAIRGMIGNMGLDALRFGQHLDYWHNLPERLSLEGSAAYFSSDMFAEPVNYFGLKLMALVAEIQGAEKRGERPEGNLKIAAGIPLHDLTNAYGNVSAVLRRLKEDLNGIDEKTLQENVSYFESFRAIAIGMAYVAGDGDQRFLSKVPASELEQTLRIALSSGGSKKMASFESDESGYFGSADFVALLQLAKNAARYSPEFSISVEEREGYAVSVVRDTGKGFRDKKGNPLPPERFSEVFGEFSTNMDGGLGLQIVKAVADLRGGYAFLASKTEANVINYDTINRKPLVLPPDGSSGVVFELYLPVVPA